MATQKKKTTKKTRKRVGGNKTYDKETIFRMLALLENNDFNYNKTATEIGVCRQTVWGWHKKFWTHYQLQKDTKGIKDQIQTITAVKASFNENFIKMRDLLTKGLELAINRTITLLEDEKAVEKMDMKDLNDYIKNVSPYCALKPVADGTISPDGSDSPTQTTFVQNIIKQMTISGHKQIDYTKKQNNIEDVTTED